MFLEYQYFEKTVIRTAEYYKVRVTFSEDEDSGHVIISTCVPQTTTEYGRNSRFWHWLFCATMRDPGMLESVYSCGFLSDWKPQTVISLSWWKRLPKFSGFRVSEKIMPATGKLIVAVVGITISTYKEIVLQLSKTEFDRLKSLGLACVEKAKEDTFPYQLRLDGNILSVKLKK